MKLKTHPLIAYHLDRGEALVITGKRQTGKTNAIMAILKHLVENNEAEDIFPMTIVFPGIYFLKRHHATIESIVGKKNMSKVRLQTLYNLDYSTTDQIIFLDDLRTHKSAQSFLSHIRYHVSSSLRVVITADATEAQETPLQVAHFGAMDCNPIFPYIERVRDIEKETA